MMIPTSGRPPELEYRQAVQKCSGSEPGDIHYLLGAGAASYAVILLVLTGMVIAPFPSALLLLAYIVGMTGGWIIREVAQRQYRANLLKTAWELYYARRRVEFAAWNG